MTKKEIDFIVNFNLKEIQMNNEIIEEKTESHSINLKLMEQTKEYCAENTRLLSTLSEDTGIDVSNLQKETDNCLAKAVELEKTF